MLDYILSSVFRFWVYKDDLWDAMEEYKEAKEMMLDIGRQILLKVKLRGTKKKTKTNPKTKTNTNSQHGKAGSVEGLDGSHK